MDGFKNAAQMLSSMQNYFEFLKNIIEQSETRPELLLSDQFLAYPLDRDYIFAGLISCFGEEGFEMFLDEYFDKIIKLLTLKIPMKEIVLVPQVYQEKYVLIGHIKDEPKIIIDTFSKTLEHVQDERLLALTTARNESLDLLTDLEMNLNDFSNKYGSLIAKKQKYKNQFAEIVTQIGAEKQELSKLNAAIEEFEAASAETHDLAEKYLLRLVKQFDFRILKNPSQI